MSARTADPGRTYAVLVGVEKYDGDTITNLSGPVRDVLDFYEWLRGKGVPAGQITTLASPMDENAASLSQSGAKFSPARSMEVQKAFTALQGKSGDLLFVFWAGHGIIHEKQHSLICADATNTDKWNFDFDKLRESLNTTSFKGFPQQIIIIDACALRVNLPFTTPGTPLSYGKPLSHDQFVFLAARDGEAAVNLPEKRGLFSREFFKQVSLQPDSTWPPDMLSLATRVQSAFLSLRALGQPAQTPVYEWSRDWDGNINRLPAVSPPRSEGQPRIRGWKLDFQPLTKLTNALMACSKMSDSLGRQDVLGRMRSNIAGAVSRRSDTKSDVMNILETASKYPGGLEELLFVIRSFEGDSAVWTEVEEVVTEVLPDFKIPEAVS
jgi:Caspase domain/Effector-associated domain 2